MNILSLFLVLSSLRPGVAVGPEIIANATALDAPIDAVTVYSDRARIRRVGSISLSKGTTAVRLPDLPGGVLLETIRVESKAAALVRVEVKSIQLERLSLAQADELLHKFEEVNDRLAYVHSKFKLIDESIAFTARLKPKLAVSENHRVGKPLPPINPSTWTRVLDFLSAERKSLYSQKVALQVQERSMRREHAALRRAIEQYDLGGISDKKTRLVALLDVPARRTVSIGLTYFVPGAHWRPNYDLHFDSNKNRVTVRAAGLISQSTGETWANVRLRLSTALPGHGIALPKLATWVLGEERAYVPYASERGHRQKQTLMAAPIPRKVTAERLADARRAVLSARVERLRQLANRAPEIFAGIAKGDEGRMDGVGGIGSQRLSAGNRGLASHGRAVKSKAHHRRSAARRRPRVPPRPAKSASRVSRTTSGAMNDTVSIDRDQIPASGLGLALFSADAPRPRSLADNTLPAMLAGGMDYVFDVPQRITIASDGKSLRAPFDSRRYAVETFYEATPSIEKTAYLKAQVLYTGRLPMLAGPANIFINGRFTSNSMLKTTGPNGRLSLPLGADEDVRLIRNIVSSSKTEGIFSKEDVTRYTVTLSVGNYKRRPVSIQLVDQVPKSNIEDIKIERIRLPKGLAKPDGRGILRWRLNIPAGKTETIVFSYDIRRPADWRLNQ